MKLAVILSLASSALVLASPVASPDPAPAAELQKRLTCQACSIGVISGSEACCSLSCIVQHGNWHGGHCDSKGYCICN
ncbi:hypothetical protein VTI28DRAFT_6024 [Corynascus sepedonium]|uniref:Invertebrate defensins family profile domain-containing protein n=1 Tax=Corynascus novoguineensis TaxID=1126955 RepID=A0AAN7HNE2_9PEZI|nr:hypothetical protein C7999DRAFT_32557 [Corynascus novoguineensis]